MQFDHDRNKTQWKEIRDKRDRKEQCRSGQRKQNADIVRGSICTFDTLYSLTLCDMIIPTL